MDNYSQGQMIGIGIAFLILPIPAVGARLWAKRLGRKGIRLDDYLIIAALAFSIACCTVQLIAAIDGQLGQHQTVGADGQPLLDDPRFLTYEKCKFASQILAVIGLGLTKASILLFYISIFSTRTFKLWAHVMLAIVTMWTVSFFFSNLFTCYPITALVEAFYGNDCVNGPAMWYSGCATDVVVDCMILAMPIPMALRLQLPLQQRIAILGMFLLGALVCAVSITRLYVYIHVGNEFLKHYNDETYITSPVFFWTSIEMSLAVVSACLPTLRPIWLLFKGRQITPNRSLKMSSYSRFGRSKSDNNNIGSSNGNFIDEDQIELYHGPWVNTVVETGNTNARDGLDTNKIRVERDISTKSQSRHMDPDSDLFKGSREF